jgi:quinol monooxygenase YgiN
MPTIEPGTVAVTHINVFTVEPDKQQALVDSLIETVKEAKHVPGWISASIHRSFDGRQVVNYVQFESHAAAQAVTKHLLSRGLIQRNVALGSVAPGQYEVAYALEKDEGPGIQIQGQ